MLTRRPILVTGSHRSGTGWVGDMLAATSLPSLGLVWEPFNLTVGRGVCDAPFRHWFTYICEDNADAFEAPLRDTLAFRYHPVAAARSIRSPRKAARAVRDRSRFARMRRARATALMKDPIAVFSAPWLADTFDMDVVVTIRHPAAMVASVMRLGWQHPFEHFLAQPSMMRDVLVEQAETIEWFASEPRSVLDQASLLWALVYARVLTYREVHPEWHFVRHEDLSLEPIAGFEKLYASLDLMWTSEVEAVVHEHTRAGNAVEVHDPSDHHRNSRAALKSWKRRLTQYEVDRIRSWTEPVASAFYDDDDW